MQGDGSPSFNLKNANMSDSPAQKQGPSGADVMRISAFLHLGNILAEFHLLATLFEARELYLRIRNPYISFQRSVPQKSFLSSHFRSCFVFSTL